MKAEGWILEDKEMDATLAWLIFLVLQAIYGIISVILFVCSCFNIYDVVCGTASGIYGHVAGLVFLNLMVVPLLIFAHREYEQREDEVTTLRWG